MANNDTALGALAVVAVVVGLGGWWMWSSFGSYEMKQLYNCIEQSNAGYDHLSLESVESRSLFREYANGENMWIIEYRVSTDGRLHSAYCRW